MQAVTFSCMYCQQTVFTVFVLSSNSVGFIMSSAAASLVLCALVACQAVTFSCSVNCAGIFPLKEQLLWLFMQSHIHHKQQSLWSSSMLITYHCQHLQYWNTSNLMQNQIIMSFVCICELQVTTAYSHDVLKCRTKATEANLMGWLYTLVDSIQSIYAAILCTEMFVRITVSSSKHLGWKRIQQQAERRKLQMVIPTIYKTYFCSLDIDFCIILLH